MLGNGWLEEVKDLKSLGFNDNTHPMESLGYKYLIQYLKGERNLNDTIERIKIETRQFARKQIKWFDKEEMDITIDIPEISNEVIFRHILQAINDF